MAIYVALIFSSLMQCFSFLLIFQHVIRADGKVIDVFGLTFKTRSKCPFNFTREYLAQVYFPDFPAYFLLTSSRSTPVSKKFPEDQWKLLKCKNDFHFYE